MPRTTPRTTPATPKEDPTMSKAPKSAAPVVAMLAALATKRADPRTFHVDPALPGLAGVLVLYRAPAARPTPTVLRTAFDDSISRAHPGAYDDAARSFLAGLPEVVSPVAALGLAVRVARDSEHEWKHNGRAEGHSRWTYCDSRVTTDSVSIHGSATCAEARPDGVLSIDPDVPADIATALRDAYSEARGVVEPSRIVALVATFLKARGGRAITSDCYLLPETSPTLCGVLAGLVDLDGWAEVVPVADPARIARLSSPVSKSIEEQIADVVAATQAFVAQATAVATGAGGSTMQINADGTNTRAGDTARAKLAEVRAAVSLWSGRLGLASLDMEASTLATLDAAIDDADARALAAVKKQREDRKLAKEAAALTTPAALAALDEADAVAEARKTKGPRAHLDGATILRTEAQTMIAEAHAKGTK